MKKKISKIKHLIVLVLIFLFSINTFATSISENDGSAFISKSEFDALKSNFQSKIDEYNTNIDSKIDEAIASYLSGVKISNENSLRFINESWESCYEIEGLAIENQYDWPEKALYFGMMTDNYASNWYSASGMVAASIDSRAPLTQARIMCDAGTDPKTNAWPTYVTWEGWATDFKEKITWVRLGGRHAATSTGTDWWSSKGVDKWTYTVTNGTKWNQGYVSSNAARYVPTGNKYRSDGGGSSNDGNLLVDAATDFYLQNNEITYEPDDMYYKHIIVYDKIASMSVTDKDWTLHVNNCNNDDNDTSVLWYNDTWNAQGYVDVSEAAAGTSGNMIRHKAITKFYPGDARLSTTSAHTRPHVGLSRKKYEYDKIKQQKDQLQVKNGANRDVYGATRDVLDTGLATFPLVKDTKFTWDFKVGTTILNPLESSIRGTYTGKYLVYLTLGGFDEKIKPISGELIKNGKSDHWVTDDAGKCTISFDVPDDGILYAKWVPFEGPVATESFISKLDFKDNQAKYSN